jgi:hypothetical protein
MRLVYPGGPWSDSDTEPQRLAIVLRLKERPANKIKNKSVLDRMFRQHHAKAFGSLVKL